MTVFYLVTHIIPKGRKAFREGIYKIIGKWYNVFIDFVFPYSFETEKKLKKLYDIYYNVVSEDIVKRHVIELVEEYQKSGLIGVYYKYENYKLKYGDCNYGFKICYSFPEHESKIYYFLNNKRYEILIRHNPWDYKKIDFMRLYDEIYKMLGYTDEIRNIDEIRKFTTLKELHNYLSSRCLQDLFR